MKRTITLFLTLTFVMSVFLFGCTKQDINDADNNGENGENVETTAEATEDAKQGFEKESSMELEYATQFAVDYYTGGYKLITLSDESKFLVIPEGGELPEGIEADVVPLYQPIENIYQGMTSSMCMFDALGRLDAIAMSDTNTDGWYIENVRAAMENGSISYVGEYNSPDYEMMLQNNCPLAIESLMIGYASDVQDKLSELGIAVLIDQSNLETHPLGRSEWIKLYAALVNEEEKANEIFADQVEYMNAVLAAESTDKTAAFFHINSSGSAVVRKKSDYISKMIELAGGQYVFDDLNDENSSSSTMTMEMEAFYEAAREADYIIYNAALGGDVASIDELVAKNKLLSDFKAVKDGNVWCTGKNLYQDTTHLGEMTESFHKIFTGEADSLSELPFLYRLK